MLECFSYTENIQLESIDLLLIITNANIILWICIQIVGATF